MLYHTIWKAQVSYSRAIMALLSSSNVWFVDFCYAIYNNHEFSSMWIKITGSLNPFPNSSFWNCPKFKEAADSKWNVAIKEF